MCSSRALSRLRALFRVGAWCSDPGTHLLSFGSCRGLDTPKKKKKNPVGENRTADKAWQGRAGQGRAGQGRAGQGRAGQGRAGQGRTCQALPAVLFSPTGSFFLFFI